MISNLAFEAAMKNFFQNQLSFVKHKPLFGLVCLVAILSPLFWVFLLNSGSEHDSQEGDPKNFPYEKVAPDIYWRIQSEQVAPLQAETFAESLERLWNIDMYIWPGLCGLGEGRRAGFPLAPEEGFSAVRGLLSNRRFLKVFAELSALPKKKASALVKFHLDKCFDRYKTLFAEFADLDPEVETVGPTYFQGKNKGADGRGSLEGTRFKILGLVLIAGNLELKDTHEYMKKVSFEGVMQYVRFSDPKKSNFRSEILLITAGLYCRQIVTGALVKTHPDPQKEKELFKEYSLNWEQMEMPHYDAAATPFDLTARIVPPDFSKGKLVIRYVSNMTDQVFFSLGRKMDKENWEKARP
jgi:hypothetical protein